MIVDSRVDGYNAARDWWNSQEENAYVSPIDHLLELMGLARDQAPGKYQYGQGWVFVERKRPAYYCRSEANADEYRRLIAEAAKTVGLEYKERNYFLKRRGPYLLASVMNESISNDPLTLDGRFVNLFDPKLEILKKATINPNERAWLLDLARVTAPTPALLASSCRVESMKQTDDGLVLEATSPSEITAVTLLKLDAKPARVLVDGVEAENIRWDEESQTLFFAFRSTGKATIVVK